MESTLHVFSFRMVFSSLRPRAGFLTSSYYYVRIQSRREKKNVQSIKEEGKKSSKITQYVRKWRRSIFCLPKTMFVLVWIVSHLRPMVLSVLGYQSQLLQRCHPVNACGHEGPSHLSLPGSHLNFFYRDASSARLQLVNQWLNFTYSRFYAFHYGRQNK